MYELYKFIYSIGLITFGLFFGQATKLLVYNKVMKKPDRIETGIGKAQRIALLGLNPIINISAFWGTRLDNPRLAILPILGVGAIMAGGLFGFLSGLLMKQDRKQKGSLIISGSFSNTSSFGGLICFMFFGEQSYAFVSMFRLCEEILLYGVGFPIAKLYGADNDKDTRFSRKIKNLIRDPFIIASFCSIIAGGLLNISGVERPEALGKINGILIPVSSFILVYTVGYRIRFSALAKYRIQCFSIGVIKFLLIPLLIISCAHIGGMQSIQDGMVFKVIVILSVMPPAFTSLIPSQIYGLDLDLSNSCWLTGTGALVIVIPILYIVLRMF